MKYGLLYYKDTDNIGDDIQTYAASRFIPRIDYMIDRENLNGFVPHKKEYVKTIMNAWYIHDKINFDISPYIHPLFISMFFKYMTYEDGTTFGTEYINNNVISMLKEFSPVGARDKHTEKIMKNLGIDTYFSGCMTLTIEPFNNVKKEDYIVVVGLTKEEIAHIKKQTNRKVIEFIQDVPKYSFSDETWEMRKNRVIDTLKLYQSAHMVITTKLHCSLPTLALGTPVLLLYDKSVKENKDRIGSYVSFLNHMDREEFLNSNYNFEKPKKNPQKYLMLKDNLVKVCTDFISSSKKLDSGKLLDPKDYKYFLTRSSEQKRVLINKFKKLSLKYRDECAKSNQMYKKINDDKNMFEEKINELNNRMNMQKFSFEEQINNMNNINQNICSEKESLERELNYFKKTLRFKIFFSKKRLLIVSFFALLFIICSFMVLLKIIG